MHGYHVGRLHGRPPVVRREILTRCYLGALMPAFPAAAMEAWGAPATDRRLSKITSFLTFLIGKHRYESKMQDSVKDWQADLEFVREAFQTPTAAAAVNGRAALPTSRP